MFNKLKSFISSGLKVAQNVTNTIKDPAVEKSFVIGTVIGIIKNRMLEIDKEYYAWVLTYGNNKSYTRTTAYQVFKAQLEELQKLLDTVRKL